MTPSETNTRIHQGRNVRRFRELLNMKQEALALELGDDWNQKKISLLEQKEIIDDDLLEDLSRILRVPVEAIKDFTEEAAITYFNNFYDYSSASGSFSSRNYTCTFNPFEKFQEELVENKRLHEENVKLYERLLQLEREKNELLERMLKEK